jgi:putative FmdB family regulatory protein
MPTYDYRCPEGHETERFFRKISDATSEIECPVCAKPAIRKVSGGAGLLFKGSGFYLTDYGKNAHRRSGPDSKSGASSDNSGSSSSGGADKKPDSGAPSKTSESKPSESKPADKPAAKPSTDSKSSSSKKSDG